MYFPLETLVSLPELWSPYYIIDLIAMVLLFWGARRSLRARPRPAPGVLTAAFAWTAANGWRATFDRVYLVTEGGELDYGSIEMCAVICGTGVALACLALSLKLIASRER